MYAAVETLRQSAQEDRRSAKEDIRVSGEQQVEADLASVEAKREEIEERVEAARSEFGATVVVSAGVVTTSVAGAAAESPPTPQAVTESPVAEIAGLGAEEIATLPTPLPEPVQTAEVAGLGAEEVADLPGPLPEPFEQVADLPMPLPEPAGVVGMDPNPELIAAGRFEVVADPSVPSQETHPAEDLSLAGDEEPLVPDLEQNPDSPFPDPDDEDWLE